MKLRRILGFLCALVMCVSLCSFSVAESESAVKLVIGVEAGSPNIAFYKSIAPDYTAQTGVEVEFVEMPHDNMHERFLQEAISQTGAIDIFNTDQPWVSEFASNGYLTDLTGKLTEEEAADFYPAALEASSYNGALYSIPYFIHTPVVFYRTDLFEAAGLSVPTTWEEYEACAKALTDEATGVYGTIVEAKQAGEPVTHLVDWLYQAGADIVDINNNVLINSDATKKVFNYLLKLMYEDKSVMPGSVGYDCTDVHTLFMQGKVAMVKNWPYMFAMASDPEQSVVSDKFAVAVQPAGENQQTAVWTWGFSISASSTHQQEAWDFIHWATSAEQLAKLGIANMNPVPRVSSLEMVKADTSLSQFVIDSIDVMTQANSYGRNATENPSFPAIQTQLGVTLSQIMTQQLDVDTALQEAEAAIKDILAE